MENATLQNCRDWAAKLRLYDTLSYSDVQSTLLILAIMEGVLTLVSLVVFLIPVKRLQVRSSWLIATVLYGHFSLINLFFGVDNQRNAMTIDKPLVEAAAECAHKYNIKLPKNNMNNMNNLEIHPSTKLHVDTIFIFACCCIAGILFLRFFQIIADAKSTFNDIVDNFNSSFKPSFDLNEFISQPPSVATSTATSDYKKKRRAKDENNNDLDSSCDSQSTSDASFADTLAKEGTTRRKEGSEGGDSDLEIV